MNVGLLVEGHGEVSSAPTLVRRVAEFLGLHCAIRTALRVSRSALVKPRELERAVTLLGNKVGAGGAVLVLIDADDDAACTLGPELLRRARTARPDRRIGVVLAVREYEAWFLTAAASLRGKRGLPADLEPPPAAETIRDAKRWLAERMPRGYSPTVDQPALTAMLDLEQARASPSFDKLVREVRALITPDESVA
ncbi:MAG: DUF4276 family protein [Deltaproteobacteria bacterium]|nr:MAG: DUF4276 family protein [Deltaproteobacteria bacterium]TMQ09797.1 MAG: DUF4276 family protein [Deltaproteobacteria bacterium]